MSDMDWLTRFVVESNKIEGILETTQAHIDAHRKFLHQPISVVSLVELVGVLQPDAVFRNKIEVPGVRVGGHVAPPSGGHIEFRLAEVIAEQDPWKQHVAYETLHPFTDGNGRSGRAIWMKRHYDERELDFYALQRGFLHSWYYHTLQEAR